MTRFLLILISTLQAVKLLKEQTEQSRKDGQESCKMSDLPSREIHCRIEPGITSPLPSIREFFSYRYVLVQLVSRDLQSRFSRTWLGYIWLILHPLCTALVFSIIFSIWGRMPTDGISPILFHLSGLIPWIYFSSGLKAMMTSMSKEANLVRKVYIPKLVFPIAKLLSVSLDFGISLLLFLIALTIIGHRQTISLPLLSGACVAMLLLTMACGLCLSVTHIISADTAKVTDTMLKFLMYASPVFYSTTIVPESWQPYYFLNPLTSILNLFRWSLFSIGMQPGRELLTALAIAIALLVVGLLSLQKYDGSIADIT